jgi:hypothetical protein
MSELFSRRKRTGAMLLNTVIRRKGETAKRWYRATDEPIQLNVNDGGAIAIHFTIPAGGQGQTSLAVAIKPEDFSAVIAMMAATDPDVTLRAMAEEMRYQLCGPSKVAQ